MRTRKNLTTALMAFFALTLFFACEKGEDFVNNDLETIESQEISTEQEDISSKDKPPTWEGTGGGVLCDLGDAEVGFVPNTNIPSNLYSNFVSVGGAALQVPDLELTIGLGSDLTIVGVVWNIKETNIVTNTMTSSIGYGLNHYFNLEANILYTVTATVEIESASGLSFALNSSSLGADGGIYLTNTISFTAGKNGNAVPTDETTILKCSGGNGGSGGVVVDFQGWG